jgi:hypothetical protein
VVDDEVVQRDAATLQPGVIVRAGVVARKPMAVWMVNARATNGAAHSRSSLSNRAASSKRLPVPLADGHREDHPGSLWSTHSRARAEDQKIRGVLGHETSPSQPQYVGPAVWAVIGGHEVVPDQQ